jgi:hypothetical protein
MLCRPDSPVKNTVNPCLWRGGWLRRSSATTSENVNHSGMSLPVDSRERSSVPDRFNVRAPSGTSMSMYS